MAEHPITVIPFKGRVVVESKDGAALVDSTHALELREASYPPVYYVPRADAKMAAFEKTEHHTHCPHKGDASYFTAGGAENGVWTYETPFEKVAPIKEHLAFYPNKFVIKVTPE